MHFEPKTYKYLTLINTANAGVFSSDETIKRYAKEIWNVSGNF